MASRGRRRRSGRSRRPPPLHGWDSDSANINIDVGSPPEPFMTPFILQQYQGSTDQLVGEPDPFYCQRVIIDMFPFLGRFDESDTSTIRFWQYLLLTIDADELGRIVEAATALFQSDFYDNSSALWQGAARILQQGVAPVYFTTLLNQTEMGGPLCIEEVESPGDCVTVLDSPFGVASRHLDLSVNFSLKEGQVLALLISCGGDPEWVTGDSLSVQCYYKSLWTQRRTG